jgi:hypothetical protein
MNMEAAGSSEMSVIAHKAQRCHNLRRCKNFVITETHVRSLNLTNTINHTKQVFYFKLINPKMGAFLGST